MDQIPHTLLRCGSCGSYFALPTHELAWLLEAKRLYNPMLRIICSQCGKREADRLGPHGLPVLPRKG